MVFRNRIKIGIYRWYCFQRVGINEGGGKSKQKGEGLGALSPGKVKLPVNGPCGQATTGKEYPPAPVAAGHSQQVFRSHPGSPAGVAGGDPGLHEKKPL